MLNILQFVMNGVGVTIVCRVEGQVVHRASESCLLKWMSKVLFAEALQLATLFVGACDVRVWSNVCTSPRFFVALAVCVLSS